MKVCKQEKMKCVEKTFFFACKQNLKAWKLNMQFTAFHYRTLTLVPVSTCNWNKRLMGLWKCSTTV